MQLRFTHLILTVTLLCCQGPKCQYDEGVGLYFNRVLNIDLSVVQGTNYYYIVPLESCESCIYDNLKFLSGVESSSLTVIFVGENPNKSWEELIVVIKQQLKTFSDPEKNIYSYETGLRKPLLILVENGKCVNSRTVNEAELTDVFSSLDLGT